MNSTLMISSFAKTINKSRKIPLRTNGKQVFLPIDHVVHIEAARNYSIIYGSNGKHWVCSKTLQSFDELLNPSSQFFRLNRSYLVNLSSIVNSFYDKEIFMVLLSNDKKIRVARRHIKAVRTALTNLECA